MRKTTEALKIDNVPPPNAVAAFLSGRGYVAPTDDLATALADAQSRLQAANEAYDLAALNAAAGDTEGLPTARAALQDATMAVAEAKAALAAAERLASQRSAETQRAERQRRWNRTIEALGDRDALAKSIDEYCEWLAKAIADLDAVNKRMCTVSPDGLPAGLITRPQDVRSTVEIALIKHKVLNKALIRSLHDEPDIAAKVASANAFIRNLATKEGGANA